MMPLFTLKIWIARAHGLMKKEELDSVCWFTRPITEERKKSKIHFSPFFSEIASGKQHVDMAAKERRNENSCLATTITR